MITLFFISLIAFFAILGGIFTGFFTGAFAIGFIIVEILLAVGLCSFIVRKFLKK